MPLNYPFVPDPTGKDGSVFNRGHFAFLQVHVRTGATGPLVPPDAGWHLHPSVVTVTNPDNIPLAWATNALDPEPLPDGSPDVYDENHATYTGIPGLFHDGGGNIALKVFIPEDAEVTASNSSRANNVAWEVLRNGDYLTFDEDFNVDVAAVLVFSTTTITWTEVTAVLSTSIVDPTQRQAILTEAAEYINAWLETYAINPDALPTTATRALKMLMLQYARLLIRQYDSSAGGASSITEVREGHDTIKFAGRSVSDLTAGFARLENLLLNWIQMVKAGSFFTYGSFTQYEAVQ